MANFLPTISSASLDPDRIGRVRIVVVGNSGCGKTSLAHFLTSGETLQKSTPTVGCNTFVKLVEYPESGAANGLTPSKPYFVELWDIGANERYRFVRSTFYSDINGVVLVHDLSKPRSEATVHRWAKELAQKGTFSSAYNAEEIAANIGGLPVPCLIVANKSDKASKYTGPRGSMPALLTMLLDWLIHQWHSFKFRRKGMDARVSSSSWPDLETAVPCHSITASAAQGRIDSHAVDDFFSECIAQRYQAQHADARAVPDGVRLAPSFRIPATPSAAQRRPLRAGLPAGPGPPPQGTTATSGEAPTYAPPRAGLFGFFHSAKAAMPGMVPPAGDVHVPVPHVGNDRAGMANGLGGLIAADVGGSGPESGGSLKSYSRASASLLSRATSMTRDMSVASSISDYGGAEGVLQGQYSLANPGAVWQSDGRIDDEHM